MKCWKCGMELEEDSLFCENCGSKTSEEADAMKTDVQEEIQTAATQEPEIVEAAAQEPEIVEAAAQEPELAEAPTAGGTWIFCPNCGKRLAEGEAFCDECGTNLLEDKPVGGGAQEMPQGGSPKKPLNKVLLAIPAVVAVVGLGVLGMNMLGGGASKEKVPDKLAYFQDDTLMLIDLKKKKAEPVEITDSYLEDGGYYEQEDILSADGKYLFYKERYDGDTYKLYRAKVSKPEAGEEIDSRISSHKILEDNTVLYVKKDKLYWFDGKNSVDFGKNIGVYIVDESGKNICWSEAEDGETGAKYYYQDLAQKKEKVQLEKNVTSLRYSKDLTKFYAIKDNGKLYELDNKGNSSNIDKDVAEIKSFHQDTGEIYYIKDEPQTVSYSEVVYDDTNMMSASERESLVNNSFDIPSHELYYYGGWGKEALLVSENYGDRFTSNGTYCLYSEYPSVDDLRVKWSEIESSGVSSAIRTALEENSMMKLAVGERVIGGYEDIRNYTSRYNKESGKLYICSTDSQEEESDIYVTTLTGKNAGVLAEYDTDVYPCKLLTASKDGLWYLKDYEDSSGDLYFNGEKVKSDVYDVKRPGDSGKMMCLSDYYQGTFEVSLYDGKKDTPVDKDVSFAECADDGTMVLLSDYDERRGEGDLMYFDGKELRKLDDEVSQFAVRRGSLTSN